MSLAIIEYPVAGGGGGGSITGANSGLKVLGGTTIQFGQGVSDPGDPAALLDATEIPMGGNPVNWIGGSTVLSSSQHIVGNGNLLQIYDDVVSTGNQSQVYISPSWNTTGTPTVLVINALETASNVNSLFEDFQINGVSSFSVRKDGYVAASTGFEVLLGAVPVPTYLGATLDSKGFSLKGVNSNNGDTFEGLMLLEDDNGNPRVTIYTMDIDGSLVTPGLSIGDSSVDALLQFNAPSLASASSITGDSLALTNTTSSPNSYTAINVAANWNTSGTGNVLFANVINTASAAASRLINLQISSVPVFQVLMDGSLGFSVTPTAKLHLPAGTTTLAPLKLTSGALLTAPAVGAVEFLTDSLYATITTGTARKEITLNDSALTSGRVPFATTNGRLQDSANLTYTTNRLSPTYITLAAGTATAGTAPLVFTSGALLTTPIAGAFEFLTDTPSITITTGTARKNFALLESTITGGRALFANSNGRVSDNANFMWNNGGTSFGVGVGVTASARFHALGSSATAGTAQLKFGSGTVMTTPETGAFEYNGTNLFFTRTGTTRENILTGVDAAAAPSTTAAGTVTNRYGGATNFLGDPVSWASVVINGTTYKIPLYT